MTCRAVRVWASWWLFSILPIHALALSDADAIRILVDSAQRICTFSGKYSFHQDTYNGYVIDAIHEYRWQDDSLFVSHDEALPDQEDGARRLQTFARHEGLISSLISRPAPATGDPPVLQGRVGWSELPLTESAYFSPADFFTASDGTALYELFEAGEVSVERVEGITIIRHYDEEKSQRHDFFLDKRGLLVKREMGSFPNKRFRELYEEEGGDANELFLVRNTIELRDYSTLMGISFPMTAVRTTYSNRYSEQEKRVMAAIWERMKSGIATEEEVLEHLAWQYRDRKAVVAARQTLLFDVHSIRINERFDEEEFKISFPKGTKVVELGGGVTIVGAATKGMVQDLAQEEPAADVHRDLEQKSTAMQRKVVENRSQGNSFPRYWHLGIAISILLGSVLLILRRFARRERRDA